MIGAIGAPMHQIPEPQLRSLVIRCLSAGGYQAELPEVLRGHFVLRLRAGNASRWRPIRVAIRSITRDTRASGAWVDRLKIQKTGLADVGRGELDALLGLNVVGDEPVVAAIDVAYHVPARGRSTNVQFPERIVEDAVAFGTEVSHVKPKTGEIVRAFPGLQLGSFLDAQPRSAVAPRQPKARGSVAKTPHRTYTQLARDPAFAKAVRALYKGRCGACGLAFDLAEAAHLVPHALTQDNTPENGVLLCPNHHAAFDHGELIAFGPDRRIWVNGGKIEFLKRKGRTAGLAILVGSLMPVLRSVDLDQRQRLTDRFDMIPTNQQHNWRRVSRKGSRVGRATP